MKNRIFHMTIAFTWMVFCTFSYGMNKEQITLTTEQLISDPLAILQYSYQTKKEYLNVLSSSLLKENTQQDIFNTLYNTVKEFHAKNPLFLVNECPFDPEIYDHSCTCDLSRKENPHIRRSFEKYMSSALVKKIRSKKGQSVNYIGFGSGGAFSDLIIISEALQQEPEAIVDIFLIDPIYSCYNAVKTVLNSPKDQLNTNYLEKLCQTNAQIKENISKMGLSKFAQLFVTTQSFNTHFIEWLRSNFPKATLRIALNSSYKQYIDAVKSFNLTPADIIVASDITSGSDKQRGSLREFASLCLHALNEDDSSLNYLLDFFWNNHSGKFILTTISLSQLNEKSIIRSTPIYNKSKIDGYINDQNLMLVCASDDLSISPTCYIKSLLFATILYWIHQNNQ